MRTYEEISIPRQHITKVVCDLCPASTERWENWKDEKYATYYTEVVLHDGWSYPGDSTGKRYYFDICPECFSTKLVPSLLAMGAVGPHEENYD